MTDFVYKNLNATDKWLTWKEFSKFLFLKDLKTKNVSIFALGFTQAIRHFLFLTDAGDDQKLKGWHVRHGYRPSEPETREENEDPFDRAAARILRRQAGVRNRCSTGLMADFLPRFLDAIHICI